MGLEKSWVFNVLTETGLPIFQVKEGDGVLMTMGSQGWGRESKAREVFGTDT